MDLAEFSIDNDGATVVVNGDPVPGIVAVRVDYVAGQVPTVAVRQLATVEPLSGRGVVHVEIPVGAPAAAAVVGWLDQLDPETLEQQAMDRQGWGKGSLAAEILDVLRSLARDQL